MSNSEQVLRTAALELLEPARVLEGRKSITTLELQSGVGIPGRQGANGDLHIKIDQSVPAATWVHVHGLGKYPSVTVIDSAGSVVIGAVTYLDLNTVQIEFAGAFAGTAYYN